MEVHGLESLHVFFLRRLPELFQLLLNKVHLLAAVAIAPRVDCSLALLGGGRCRRLGKNFDGDFLRIEW